MQKHLMISHLISVFSDLEIHQQIIELHRKENEILQSKLLELAKIFGISDVIIHTLQHQKERNLNKISFLYSRLESFIQRDNYFNTLKEKIKILKNLFSNIKKQNLPDCSTQSFFSNVHTNTHSSPGQFFNNKKNQIAGDLSNTLRILNNQIMEDVLFYSHDVVNYVKNMEFSNSQLYKSLSVFKKDMKQIGNYF